MSALVRAHGPLRDNREDQLGPRDRVRLPGRVQQRSRLGSGRQPGRSLSPDPLELGARFEVEASFLGRSLPLTYETVEIERPRRVTVRADSGTFSSVDTLTFEPEPGGGTLVTYDADLRLKSALKLFDPLMGIGFNRIADKARDGLRERLAGDPRAGD